MQIQTRADANADQVHALAEVGLMQGHISTYRAASRHARPIFPAHRLAGAGQGRTTARCTRQKWYALLPQTSQWWRGVALTCPRPQVQEQVEAQPPAVALHPLHRRQRWPDHCRGPGQRCPADPLPGGGPSQRVHPRAPGWCRSPHRQHCARPVRLGGAWDYM